MSVNPATGEVTGLEPHEVVQRLDAKAGALEADAASLADIRERLDPVEQRHDEFIRDFIAGMWDDYIEGKLKKWPGEDIRLALAYREMDITLRNDYRRLKADERHIIDSMGRAKEMIGAYRSILSAQKEGLVS